MELWWPVPLLSQRSRPTSQPAGTQSPIFGGRAPDEQLHSMLEIGCSSYTQTNTWYERCQRYCTLWWIAVSRSKYQRFQEAIKDPWSSLSTSPLPQLSGGTQWPLFEGASQKLLSLINLYARSSGRFVTLLPHLTGFYTTFLKRNKEQVLTSGKTDAQMFFHFILQHKVMIPLSIVLHGSYQKFLYNIGAVRDCMCMYIEVYRYVDTDTNTKFYNKPNPPFKVIQGNHEKPMASANTGISQGCPQSTSLLRMGSGSQHVWHLSLPSAVRKHITAKGHWSTFNGEQLLDCLSNYPMIGKFPSFLPVVRYYLDIGII